jgi:nucleotide sugar dehydrogenase
MSDLLSIKEVAESLGVHPVTIWRYIKEGKLNAAKIGGNVRIDKKILSEFAKPINVKPKLTTYRDLLLFGKKKIGVWGTGYIGFSTMAHFASDGVYTVGHDTNEFRVNSINNGEVYIPGMAFWLGFSPKPLVDSGRIKATLNWKDLISDDVLVHFIAVPTATQDGKPWWEPLKNVIGKLAGLRNLKGEYPPLIIIESTLTPGTTDKIIIPLLKKNGLVVGKNLLLGIAPRRDWFVDREHSLAELDRVFGATDEKSTVATENVLSIVCKKLHKASNHRTSEMVKSIENAYRQMEITLANQLSLAFPKVDIREVLKLVGTKFNIGTFQPSFGTGGYCIPLSSKYVLEGAPQPKYLTLLKKTVETDEKMPQIVADTLAEKCKSVAVLGLSYKGNIKVPELSPAITIVKRLQAKGVKVRIYDPYFEKEEIKSITGADPFIFPDGLLEFEGIAVVCDHHEFTTAHVHSILEKLDACKIILDNVGIWKDLNLNKNGRIYKIPGQESWLS